MLTELHSRSGCGKQLPSDIKAGDDCPHCGMYIAFKENADGTRTYAGIKGLRGVLGGMTIFAVIGAVIGVILKLVGDRS